MDLHSLSLKAHDTIHIIGIGGIGMSGLAKLLHQSNIQVQGSDLNENNQIKALQKLGIKIFLGHKATNIKNCKLIVKSSIINNNNIEIQEAQNNFIPIISRANLLSNMLKNQYNICITGAHGKTSTTSLIYALLKSIDLDPTVICGGIINSINSNVSKGKDFLNIVEADESDGTFMVLPTNISIITNIDNEHLDYYGSLQNIVNIYKLYITKCLMNDLVIACDDCDNLKLINKKYYYNSKFISYGINSKKADLKVTNLQNIEDGVKFDMVLSKKSQVTFLQNTNLVKNISLKNYGTHNILNALASIAVYLFKGGKKEFINKALKSHFKVQRRFFALGKINDVTFIDDYAHHPNEIKATLNMAKELSNKRSMGKVITIFQPHKYSRFKALYRQFLSSFTNTDYLIIIDIFAAGESNIDNISAKSFVNDIKGKFTNSFYSKNTTILKNKIKNLSNPGDYIIFMGAGDITNIAINIYNELYYEGLHYRAVQRKVK